MQFLYCCRLLFILFLFAFRIKTASSDDASCASNQFQCVTSGFCIDKFKYCDFIVDCQDESDEAECGSCNFQNGTCGWKNTDWNTGGNWTVIGNVLTAPKATNFTEFDLISPDLHSISYQCKMVMHVKITGQANLLISQDIPHATAIFASFTSKDMVPKQNWTQVVVPVRVPPGSVLLAYMYQQDTYTFNIRAVLSDASDQIAIKEIHFENCNPKRTIVDCDFEDGSFCHWTVMNTMNSNAISWNIGRGDQMNQTYAPTADHSTGTGSGHFAWAKFSTVQSNSENTPVAILSSIPLDFGVCISLWYYMDGASLLQLTIGDSIVGLNASRRDDDLMSQPTGAVWRYKQANIPYRNASFTIVFEALITDSSGVIAIDDIQMKYGVCTNAICDFEVDLCMFHTVKASGDSLWRRVQARQMQNLTSMTIPDHTTGTLNGHLMLFVSRLQNDNDWFTSAESDYSGYRCLQFFYFISDDNVGTLEVRHRSVYELNSGQDKDNKKNGYVKRSQSTLLLAGFWRKVTLTLPPLDRSVLDFTATAGNAGNNSFIALDDIQVANGRCRELVSCDFEYDNCGWYLDQDDSMTPFERQKPALKRRNYCLGPQADHTLQTANGHYLYFCYHKTGQLKATIKSDDFDGTANWCFSFWTYFGNVSSIEIDVNIINVDGTVPVATIKGKDSTEWKYHEFSIAGDAKYEIYILSLTVNPYEFITDEGVAIDDFNLTPFKCGYKPKEQTDPNQPGGAKIRPKGKEITEFGCNFEKNQCNYQLSNSSGVGFEVVKANSAKYHRSNTPLVDHTYHAFNGGFLQLQSSGVSQINGKYAILSSKSTISPSQFSRNNNQDGPNNQVCVDFWYVMNGEAVNWLEIATVLASNNTKQTVYRLEGTFGPTWRQQSVPISVTGDNDFYLYFTGSSSNFSDGVLALDDISVHKGSCPIEDICDFSFDSCGWDSNVSLPWRWQIKSARQLTIEKQENSIAPINDHTSHTVYGQYMYLDVGFDSRRKIAQFISPLTRPNRKCLQFWYYFLGKDIGSLNVYVLYNQEANLKYLLRSDTNSDVSQWMFAQVPLDRHFYDMDFQFVIEAKRGSYIGADYHIAIDDVEIRDFCQPIGSCDFEQDYCGYQNMANLMFNRGVNYTNWVRAHGQSYLNTSALPPQSDHTSGGGNGVFVYVDKGPVASLYTPYFSIDGQMCLTFFYFLNSRANAPVPALIVELSQLRDNETLSHVELAIIDAKSRSTDLRIREWSKHTVTIHTKGNRVMLQFGGLIQSDRNQLIALDDISLTAGTCVQAVKYKQFACVPNPKAKSDFVDYSKVCDFVRDCANGADEQGCGYQCDFTDMDCGWTVHNVTSTFVKVNLANTKTSPFKKIIPSIDHKFQASLMGSYLRLYDQPGLFVDNPEANFESPWLQNSGPLCMLVFYYYLNDPRDGNALLRVRIIESNNPLGIEVFRDQGSSEGNYWRRAEIVIGRFRGKFKVQINARMKIVRGGGVIAIDSISFSQSECMIPIKANPTLFGCDKQRQTYHCNDKQFCVGEDRLCDYQDDCGDHSDESPKYCEIKSRSALRCDFEDGTCLWRLDARLNQTHLNGMRWGAVDDIDDYAYGVKRDHTLNSQFGHLLYTWNQNKLTGRIVSPLIQGNSSSTVSCQLRLFYLYKSKQVFEYTTSVNNAFGQLNVHMKSTLNGNLFKLATVRYIRSSHFERLTVDLSKLNEPFYLVLEVVPGTDNFGIWAIDDVSFTSGCQAASSTTVTDPTFTPYPVTVTTVGLCSGSAFLCDRSMCIFQKQVCDFHTDCDDKTDEANCGIDSFATGWADRSLGRITWNINSKTGEARTRVRDGVGSDAFLDSVHFGGNGPPCSVMFNYFVEFNTESLTLAIVYTTNRSTKRAVLFNSRKSSSIQYGKWNFEKVFIGQHEYGWQLQFVATKDVVNNQTETIRLKNVKFSNCAWVQENSTSCYSKDSFVCSYTACIPKEQVCDYKDDCSDGGDERNCKYQTSYRCSFESSRNTTSTCGLELNTDTKWRRFEGLDTRNFIGPGMDHTSDSERGHFMMVTDAAFAKTATNTTTRMATPNFDGESSGNCHVRFWYMLSGVATLTVTKNAVSNAADSMLISSIDSISNDTLVWKRFSWPITSKSSYKIVFSATIDDLKTKSFIAIDDISFTSACKLHVTKPVSKCAKSGDKFECLDHSCIPFDEVCDFYPTCSQGEDELDCPSVCDFDKTVTNGSDSMCKWATIPEDQNAQSIAVSRVNSDMASKISQYYPPTDNTLKSKSGFYMLIYPLNFTYQVEPKMDFTVFSAEYSSAAASCMFSLDYYIAIDYENNGTSTYVIALDEQSEDGGKLYNLEQIETVNESTWNNWTTISMGIGRRQGGFQMSIIRLHNRYMVESLAIDNIRFTNCAYTAPHDRNHSACAPGQFTCGTHYNCIPLSAQCDLNRDCPDGSDEADCANQNALEITFEAANALQVNGFTVNKLSTKLDQLGDDTWHVVSGAAPHRTALDTGPPFDHTFFNDKGHYLYCRLFDFNVEEWLISPMLNQTDQKCVLKFYFYLFGRNSNQIGVLLRNKTQANPFTVSTIETTSQDVWQLASVQLQSPTGPFQFIISAISVGEYGSVALDDVTLSAGCVLATNSGFTFPPGSATTPTSGTTSGGVSNPTTTATTPNGAQTTTSGNSNCATGTYSCAADSNICLPQITKCNFVADCSDGSDEKAPDCTQQSCVPRGGELVSECGMSVEVASGNFGWAYSTSDDFTQQSNVQFVNMPSQFMYVNLSTGQRDDYTNVVSQIISETSASCMLTFKYACDLNNCPLQVSLISHLNKGNIKSLIWVPLNSEFIVGQSGYQEHEARIYIGHRNTFQISIGSLKQKQSVNSFVLLSEITFDNCSSAKYNSYPNTIHCTDGQFQCRQSYGNCVPTSAVCDYQQDCRLSEDEAKCDEYVGRCDFENIVLCEFWQLEETDFRWSFTTESGQHGIAYLPSIDHTAHSAKNYYLSFHSNLLTNYLGNQAPDEMYGAKFVSINIASDVTDDCRFRFWYNLIGPNCQLNIYKRYSANELVLQKTIQSDMFDYWQKVDLSLKESANALNGPAQSFQIVLKALVGLKRPCSINIDDLSLTPQCTSVYGAFVPPDVPLPNNTIGNLCKPNLMCRDKTCYALNQSCNFVQDCDDGTDEEACPSWCDFELANNNKLNMCGWYSPKGITSTFVRIKGQSLGTRTGGTGPKVDHTKGTVDGHYLVTQNFSTLNAKVQLHSPYFSSSGPNCLFSFAYFLNEPKHLDKISLFLKTSISHPSKVKKIWSYDPVKAYTQVWNKDSAPVGKQKAFSLIFEAIQGEKNSRADFALDDFQFINCHQQGFDVELVCAENEFRCDDQSKCIDYWRLCDGESDCEDGSDEDKYCTQTNGTCWFEGVNWKTHCNWVDLKRDFNFVYEAVAINASKERETNTGPQTLLDSVYGYALMKAKGHKLGERAAIASPQFPVSSGICSLSFHYYMYGSDTIGELVVYTLTQDGKRQGYFHISGNQGPQWNYVPNIMVGSAASFRVVFEGIVGSDQYSDIAIGYVSFSQECAAGRWQEKTNLKDTCRGQFYCHTSHECISKEWVCDGEEDCRDGSDELNCAIKSSPKGPSSGKGLIVALSVLAVILAISAIPGVIYGYNRFVRSQSADRVPFIDNVTFDNNLQRELSSSSNGRNKSEIGFEMTTRKSNLKGD